MRKSAEQRLYERTVKSLPMLNDESLEALLRLVRQLQTARRMGRSALLNAHSRDGKVLAGEPQAMRPNANIPQRLESEDV